MNQLRSVRDSVSRTHFGYTDAATVHDRLIHRKQPLTFSYIAGLDDE